MQNNAVNKIKLKNNKNMSSIKNNSYFNASQMLHSYIHNNTYTHTEINVRNEFNTANWERIMGALFNMATPPTLTEILSDYLQEGTLFNG